MLVSLQYKKQAENSAPKVRACENQASSQNESYECLDLLWDHKLPPAGLQTYSKPRMMYNQVTGCLSPLRRDIS